MMRTRVRVRFVIMALIGLAVASSSAYSESWDMSADYSWTYNPNGAWSYGRKWSPESGAYDLMTVRWGSTGWYLGNYGHGGPSIQAGPALWAKDNSNGLPVVRWTCPKAGSYDLACTFTGIDSRGVISRTP